MSKEQELTVLDLFSGGGGMSAGFANTAGFRIVGAVDIQKGKPSSGVGATHCNETYEFNLGITPLDADLAETEPKYVGQHFSINPYELGVLISCAPCTGFSQKNARNLVIDDGRNALVPRSALFVEHFMPKYFVMENVKELLSGKHKHHFIELHQSLERLGYSVSFEVHNLADFGLPQNRKRALILAKRGNQALRFRAEKSQVTVREAISHLPPLRAGQTHESDKMHVCPSCTELTLERMRAIPHDGGSWIDIPDDKSYLRIPSMNVEKPGSYPDIYGRLAWDKQAPTITRECGNPGNGRYTHPDQDRHLSVREMALLQGFPFDYVFCGKLSAKYNQIGDAVPPLISKKIAEIIKQDNLGMPQQYEMHVDQLHLFN